MKSRILSAISGQLKPEISHVYAKVRIMLCAALALPAACSVPASASVTFSYSSDQLCTYEITHMTDLDQRRAAGPGVLDPFVLALTNPTGYTAEFPACNYLAADINDDGLVNAFDIDPFVLLLK